MERSTSSDSGIVHIGNIKISPFVIRRNPKINSSAIFIDESRRQFLNPISYLGGPRLETRNRNSVDSILSLDWLCYSIKLIIILFKKLTFVFFFTNCIYKIQKFMKCKA